MTRLTALGLAWSAGVTIVALGVEALSRRWRRHDGAFWHQVWVAFVLATSVGAVIAAVTPAPTTWQARGAWLTSISDAGRPLAPLAPAIAIAAGAISLFLLARLAAGWTRVGRLGRLAQPAFGIHAERLAAVAGPGAAPAVEFRIHRRVRTPVTIGWRRPLILLPESWIGWPVERLAAIVQHELAHVRRRDYCWNLIAAALEATLWFVPGIWIAARRVRLCAELAADASASSRVGPIAYARHLVETAAGMGRRGRLAPFSLALGATTDLQRRVDVLLDAAPRPPASARRARIAALGVAAALVWLAFACRAASAPPAHTLADHAALHALKHQH